MTRLDRLARRLVLAWTVTAAATALAKGPTQPAITAFRANPEPVLAGTPTTYAWALTGARESVACTLDPGDGTPTITLPDCATPSAIRHTYATPGDFTATLHLQPDGPSATAHVTVDKTRPSNAAPGTVVWTYQTGFISQSYLYSSAAIASDGTIIFGSGDRHIYALNPDGTLKWKVATHKTTQGPSEAVRASGMAYAAPSIAGDGTTYVPVMDDGLYAIKPDGTLEWRVPIHDVLDHPAAIARDGTIYLAPEHQLDAFHPNGQPAWSFRAQVVPPFTLESTPAIARDGTIYLCSEHDGSVYALNPNGTLKWRFPHSGYIFGSSPAIGRNGTSYFAGAFDHTLYAIDSDGTLKWKLQAGNRFESPPSIGPHGTIYIANDNGVLYAINPDGTLEWHHSIETATDRYKPHLISDTPTIGNNGVIYLGSDNGAIYALHSDGTLAWTLHTPKPIESAPAIASNGILYVTSTSGALYAIHVTATGLANSPWPTLQHDNRRTGRVP
jgi:outer membrane protein assembly factor BamB